MFCHKCGANLPEGSVFCGACGTRQQPEAASFCGSCGSKLNPGVAFCGLCGAPQGQQPAQQPVQQPIPQQPIPQPVQQPVPQPAAPQMPGYAQPMPPQPPVYAQPAAYAAPPQAPQPPKAPKAPKSGKPKGKLIAIIAIALVLVAALVVGAIFLFGGSEEERLEEAASKLTGSLGYVMLENSDNLNAMVSRYRELNDKNDWQLQMRAIAPDGSEMSLALAVLDQGVVAGADLMGLDVGLALSEERLTLSIPEVLDESLYVPLEDLMGLLMDSGLMDELAYGMGMSSLTSLMSSFEMPEIPGLEGFLEDLGKCISLEPVEKRIDNADKSLKVYSVIIDIEAAVDVIVDYVDLLFEEFVPQLMQSSMGMAMSMYPDMGMYDMDEMQQMMDQELDQMASELKAAIKMLKSYLKKMDYEILYGLNEDGVLCAASAMLEFEGEEIGFGLVMDSGENPWSDVSLYAYEDGEEYELLHFYADSSSSGFEMALEVEGDQVFSVVCDDEDGRIVLNFDGEEFVLYYTEEDGNYMFSFEIEGGTIEVGLCELELDTGLLNGGDVNLLELSEAELEELARRVEEFAENLFQSQMEQKIPAAVEIPMPGQWP